MYKEIKAIEDFRDVDIDFVKNYLRVDYDDDDQFILTLMVAAQSFMETYLDVSFETIEEEFGKIPAEFIISYLAVISHWYDRREIQSQTNTEKELEYIFRGVLGLYRTWGVGGVLDGEEKKV